MSLTPLLQAVGGETSAAAAGERSPKPKRAAPSDAKKPLQTLKIEKAGPPQNDLPPLTPEVLQAARHSRTALSDEKKVNLQSSLECLREDSRKFANSAATTSLAAEAACFSKAVQEFDAGRHKKRKIADTELGKTGRILSAAALRAPASEAALAAVAIKITEESLDILLTEEDRKLAARERWCRCPCWPAWLEWLRAAVSGPEPTLPVHRRGQIIYESLDVLVSEDEDQQPEVGDCSCSLCRCACCPAWLEWLRVAISGPEPILPIHRRRQEKLIAKREVLFGVALGAPVALLTSATATNIFPSGSAGWIAGVGAFVWVAVSGAVVANQYGRTNLEFQVASCLGRLGVLGVAVLFSVYVFFAFFPSATIALVFLVCFAVGLHGCLCATSRLRGGDDHISASSGDAQDTDGSISGCRCCSCTMDV